MWYWPGALKQATVRADDSAQIAFALRYGRFFKRDFYEANDQVQRLLTENMEIGIFRNEIASARTRLQRLPGDHPFSLKALNLMFILDVIEHRLDNPDFQLEAYLAFKEKANAIRALGRDRNINARLALVYLYASYEGFLSEEEEAEYKELREPLSDWPGSTPLTTQ